MENSFSSILSFLLDTVAPPRPSERVVRELSVEQLRALVLRGEFAGALPYHDPRVTALVWELKYHRSRAAAALAGEMLSEVLLAIASESLGKPVLIPAPMHAARRAKRGYNQTELLCKAALQTLGAPAKVLEKKSGLLGAGDPRTFLREAFAGAIGGNVFHGPFDYAPHVLVRERNTLPQQGLARHVRLTNIKHSMRVLYPKLVLGRTCVVVDDVSTTGATLAEAKRALREAGASSVECIALAHS